MNQINESNSNTENNHTENTQILNNLSEQITKNTINSSSENENIHHQQDQINDEDFHKKCVINLLSSIKGNKKFVTNIN